METEPALRAFLRSRLAQGADVDDCLQSVHLAVLQHGHDVAPTARRAWLFRVAANQAARHWRDRATTDRVLEKQASYTTDTQHEDPTEKLTQGESAQQIIRAIEQLPEKWQLVVRMRLEDEKSFQTIADELEIPLGTALTRMRRALERIRKTIETENES